MSAPRSLFGAGSAISPGDMMSRSAAQAFLARIVKLSKADTIGAQLNGGYTGNIRFAANRLTTSGGVSNSQLVVQSGYGPKHAIVTTSGGVAGALVFQDHEQAPVDEIAAAARRITSAVSVPEVSERIRGFALEPTPLGPDGLAQLMKSDYDKWRRVVREAHIKVD